VAYGLALVVLALDQASKHWVLEFLDLDVLGQAPLAGPLKFNMVWNEGVSYGLLQGSHEWVRWALTAFSLGVAGFLALWARKAERPLAAVWLGLVMGGAVGNAIDRIRFGAVVDFIDANGLMFPWVFNVADSAISVGIALLLLDSVKSGPDRRAT
jgi:signal peptidase II